MKNIVRVASLLSIVGVITLGATQSAEARGHDGQDRREFRHELVMKNHFRHLRQEQVCNTTYNTPFWRF
jgi:hypothetical protein